MPTSRYSSLQANSADSALFYQQNLDNYQQQMRPQIFYTSAPNTSLFNSLQNPNGSATSANQLYNTHTNHPSAFVSHPYEPYHSNDASNGSQYMNNTPSSRYSQSNILIDQRSGQPFGATGVKADSSSLSNHLFSTSSANSVIRSRLNDTSTQLLGRTNPITSSNAQFHEQNINWSSLNSSQNDMQQLGCNGK